MSVVQVVIDRSASETFLGVKVFDRGNGGVLVAPAGASFPVAPEAGEWFWRTDELRLYRRNSANSAWDAATATAAAHRTTHEPGGSDPLTVDAAASVGSLRTIGTGALQACSGADARLSDARTPVAHKTSHEPGGGDALAVDAAASTGSLRTLGTSATAACAGNDARLSDARTPTAHAPSHKAGGTDVIRLDELGATTDVTTLNSTAAAHGLLPKLSGDAATWLNGAGAWTSPRRWLQSVFTEVAADTTSTSTTWADLLSASITTVAGSRLQIYATAGFSCSNASARLMGLRLVVDGVAVRAVDSASASTAIAEALAIVSKLTVAAGAHTVKLQWRVANTYTIRCRPVTVPDSEHCSLLVEEVTN